MENGKWKIPSQRDAAGGFDVYSPNVTGGGSIEALTYQSTTTLHVGTGRAFYLRYSGGLVDEILDNKWTPREETVGGGLWAEQQ